MRPCKGIEVERSRWRGQDNERDAPLQGKAAFKDGGLARRVRSGCPGADLRAACWVAQDFVVDTNSTYSGRIEQFLDKSACGQLPVEFRKDWYLISEVER